MSVPTQTITGIRGPLAKYGITKGLELPPIEKLRLYIMSLPGAGKTNFISSFPDTLIIDPEATAEFVPNPVAHRITPDDGKQLNELINDLCSDGPKTFKHICVDTIEKMVQVSIPYLTDRHNAKMKPDKQLTDIREFGMKGAGWGKVNDYILGIFQRLVNAGFGWTICGHLSMVTYEEHGKTQVRLEPLINPGIRGGLLRDSQYLMRVRKDTKNVLKASRPGGPKTKSVEESWTLQLQVLETSDPTTLLLKNRLGHLLPAEINITNEKDHPVGHAKLKAAYDAAREKAKAL